MINLFSFIFLTLGLFLPDVDTIETWKYEPWYNEPLIAKKFMPMAAAAYGKEHHVESCLAKVFDNAVLLKYSDTPCPGIIDGGANHPGCAAFVAIASSDRAIILSFRGSDNLLLQFVDYLVQSLIQVPARPGGKAHKYFVDIINQLASTGIFDAVLEAVQQFPQYELWITGQSLGGALASLGAGLLVDKYGLNEANIKLVTFGQPRTGDRDWARAMDRAIHTYKYRIVNGIDIVPHVPFDLLKIPIEFELPIIPDPFRVIPKQKVRFDLGIGEYWMHWTGEVWYSDGTRNAQNRFKICNTTNEDSACSNDSHGITAIIGNIVGLLRTIAFGCVPGIGIDPWRTGHPHEFIRKCFEEKLRNGIFHINAIKGNVNDLIQDHQEFFNYDFKGTGDKGCSNFKR